MVTRSISNMFVLYVGPVSTVDLDVSGDARCYHAPILKADREPL